MKKIEETDEAGTLEEAEKPSDGSRWIAAVGYIVFICFFSLWRSRKDPFIAFHAKQGFLLLLAECVALVVILIFDVAIGRLRLFGVIMVGLMQLVVGLGALTLSVVGFVKALFGEYWHLPFLGEYRDRIPELGGHEN